MYLFFFFFQAEDGIRDKLVTGVQTCALPISPRHSMRIITDLFRYCGEHLPRWNTISISGYHIREAGATAVQEVAFTLSNRSEERRVGKECRSRWSPYH